MNLEKKGLGEIKIDNNVIGMLAKNAALEVDGVVDIVKDGLIASFFNKASEKVNGVIVTNPDDYSVSITLKIKVKYGYNLLDIARKIQVKVKNAIENYANLDVESVNIIIKEVIFPEDENIEENNNIEKNKMEGEEQ